jgi:hypothetical protein
MIKHINLSCLPSSELVLHLTLQIFETVFRGKKISLSRGRLHFKRGRMMRTSLLYIQ